MQESNGQRSITFERWSLFRDIVMNFWAVILAGCIAWMGFYIYENSLYVPRYTSSAILGVRSGVTSNLSISSGMATVYGEVFEQPAMKRLAADHLQEDAFHGTVKTQVHHGTNLLTLSVVADDPSEAYRLLTALLAVYPNVTEEIFTNSVIDVLSTPHMPTSPSNSLTTMRRSQVVILAAALEGAIIVLLSLLRNTVKHEKAFKAKIDGNLVGTVAHEHRHLNWHERMVGKKRALMINDVFATLKFAEDYQRIANKLEYVHNQKGKKLFTITSVAENEGKSTTAVNIALSLAERGYRVALLDLDLRKPAIGKIFGCRDSITVEFADVLAGKIPASQFSFHRYRKSQLWLALNRRSHTDAANWISGSVVRSYLQEIRRQMDFVIVDSSSIAVSADAIHLIEMSDSALLVVRTDTVLAEDINDAILTITATGASFMGCILNDVHKPLTLFGQIGMDENDDYYHRKYVEKAPKSRYVRMPPNVMSGNDPAGREDSTQTGDERG